MKLTAPLAGLAALGIAGLGIYAFNSRTETPRAVSTPTGVQTYVAQTPALKAMPVSLATGKAVEPFTLPNYNGTSLKVGNWAADGTKATLIVWVSTRCPVSNAYNDRMEALDKAFSGRHVRVIAIDSNKAESPDDIAAFAKEKGFTFPVLKDKNNVIADRFSALVTPEAFVIDDKGMLRYHGRIDDSKNLGEVTTHDLQDALEAILAGQPVKNDSPPAFGCSIKRVEKTA